MEDEANRAPAPGTDPDVRARIATARRALDEIEASLPVAADRPKRQLEASRTGP